MIRFIPATAVGLGSLIALAGVSAAGPALAQDEARSVTGDLVACYVGQDLTNEEHLACANLCMQLAVPMVLVADDGHVYVPTGASADKLSEHVDDLVEIQGTVGEEEECRTVAVGSLQRAKLPEVQKGSGQAFTSRLVSEEDLSQVPDMSLYEYLRRHSLTRIEDYSGVGQVIQCEERETMARGGQYRGCGLYIGDRAALDPVSTARDLRIHEIRRLEILRRSDASNRYGGHGWNGAIVLTLKRSG